MAGFCVSSKHSTGGCCDMEGRLRTIVDEVLYGETERADRQGYQIMGVSPIQHFYDLAMDRQGRILIENAENREAAWGAGAFLAFVPVAVLAVLALTWVMSW